jgi:acetyl esterase/lipase
MPFGYLVTVGLLATGAVAGVLRHRPRRSSPIRLSYIAGLWLNWPSVVLAVLVASTALAVTQSGAGIGLWVGVGLACLAGAGAMVLRRRARATGPAIDGALDEALPAGWRDSVDADLAARLRRRPSLLGVLLAPISSRRRGVERIANLRYGPAGRRNMLDLYRDRSDRSERPTLIYLHGGAFRFGSKRFGARHLLHRLAADGWLCVSANYGLGSAADPLVDVKRVIAWVHEHGREHGSDADAVFVAGSSAGGRLALRAAFTPNDPALQPGFESADTSVAGVITLYAYYGSLSSDERPPPTAPPFLVVHGDQDTLVIVDDARRFVDGLRAASPNPVVYAELPGAQHGFDLFRSRRFETIIDAIEVFAAWVRRAAPR